VECNGDAGVKRGRDEIIPIAHPFHPRMATADGLRREARGGRQPPVRGVSRQGKGAGKAQTGREKAAKSQELCLLAVHRPSRFRWMLSGHTQNAAQVDESRTIQVQGRRSCATYGSAALNFQEVIGPCEVPRPSLATWVEQRDSSPG
jgi:hypothetical protein